MTERTATTIFRTFRLFNRSTSDNTGLEEAMDVAGFFSDMTSPNWGPPIGFDEDERKGITSPNWASSPFVPVVVADAAFFRSDITSPNCAVVVVADVSVVVAGEDDERSGITSPNWASICVVVVVLSSFIIVAADVVEEEDEEGAISVSVSLSTTSFSLVCVSFP